MIVVFLTNENECGAVLGCFPPSYSIGEAPIIVSRFNNLQGTSRRKRGTIGRSVLALCPAPPVRRSSCRTSRAPRSIEDRPGAKQALDHPVGQRRSGNRQAGSDGQRKRLRGGLL